MKKRKKKNKKKHKPKKKIVRKHKPMDYETSIIGESDHFHAYIAGCTSAGFTYGITHEQMKELEKEILEDEKKWREDMEKRRLESKRLHKIQAEKKKAEKAQASKIKMIKELEDAPF